MLYCWHWYQNLTTDVSSVVGAPWRCGVLTTQGGIAGIGLGRLLGGGHDPTPQKWGGGSSPVKTEPLQIVLLLLLLFWTHVHGVSMFMSTSDYG